MPINTRDLSTSGSTIGGSVFLEDLQPADITIHNKRYLQSGNVEGDTSLFDTSIWTGTIALPGTVESGPFGSSAVYAAAFGIGLFVIAGGSGILATSPDGSTWTVRTSQFGLSTIFAVKFLNGTFVAVGQGGKLSTSTDGITWTLQTTPTTANLNDVSFGSGLYLAVGSSSIITSSNLTSWTSRTHGLSSGIRGVAFGNSTYVAVGITSPNVQTSTDGITWTTGKPISTTNATGVAFGNGLFIVISTNSLNASVSADPTASGDDFVLQNMNSFGLPIDISFSNNVFYVVTATSSDLILTSGNGKWARDLTLGGNAKQATATDGSTLVVVGNSNNVISHTVTLFAGSRDAYSESGENQYIRIS